jgi:hypothetical protein
VISEAGSGSNPAKRFKPKPHDIHGSLTKQRTICGLRAARVLVLSPETAGGTTPFQSVITSAQKTLYFEPGA